MAKFLIFWSELPMFLAVALLPILAFFTLLGLIAVESAAILLGLSMAGCALLERCLGVSRGALRPVTPVCASVPRSVCVGWFILMAPRPEVPDPAEMIDRDRVMLVSDEVQQLPPRQRTVVILYYGCGLSIGEIARRERIAKETVRDALARAHARLRRSRELT